MAHVIVGFTSLMGIQFATLKVDQYTAANDLAPRWFAQFRQRVFCAYLLATSALFFIFYYHRDKVGRRNDPNRISDLKTVMELEDADFVHMVEEMNLDYDEYDLKEVEAEVNSKVAAKANSPP